MRARVIFPDNCGNNPVWDEWSWSTENPYPGLLSVSFLMDPDLSPFVINFLILAVTNIQDAQRCTSSFKYINLDGRTTSFDSLNMDLVWR